MKKMRSLILSGSNSRNSGGIFNSARTLGLTLAEHYDVDVQFLMHNDEYSSIDRKYYEPLPLHDYTILGPSNFGYSLDMYKMINQINPDIIHLQCIWMYLSKVTLKYHYKTHTPYIISPRGMLDPYQVRTSALKKKIVSLLYENESFSHASCFHALCISELESIRAFGIKRPVAVIPNGISLPVDSQTLLPVNSSNKKKLLFISRINPKKGLENLINAWGLCKNHYNNWELIIAGETKDTAYLTSLKKMTFDLKVNDSINFIGGVFGKDKDMLFKQVNAFILPSFSEGLPMAVLEAWAYKLPVLITPQCNLPEGFANNAAIKIETNPESISNGLLHLFSMDYDKRLFMGLNGYRLVNEKFTWQKVAQATDKLYQWLNNNKEKPAFVYEY